MPSLPKPRFDYRYPRLEKKAVELALEQAGLPAAGAL